MYPNNPYMNYMGAQAAMNPYQGIAPAAQQMQVIKVNGEGGANAFSMGPNSSALLLDTSGTMIWAVTPDGAGYKTVVPYDISPHRNPEQIAVKSLEDRIKRLEEMIDAGHSETDKRGGHAGESAAAAD